MPSPLDARALEIFGEMVEAEAKWESVLHLRCQADSALRAEVERLWQDYQSASADFLLDRPAMELMAADKQVDDSGSLDPLRVPEIGFGRFQLQRRLGRGGQGEVWLAVDPTLGREVALKIIPPRLAEVDALIEKLRLEAEITGRLEHPNIVPIYEAGRDSRQFPFYAMRVFRDENLQAAIDRFHLSDRSDSGLRQLLGRFIDVCEAIAYAHSHGVIHRDLKPHNVMLGEFGETLVVDWGMAKMVGQDLQPTDAGTAVPTPLLEDDSHLGQVKGTPAYMSPEQAWGQVDSLGPATDVFSLGAVLFCILTGQAPRNAKSKGVGLPRRPDKSPRLTPEEAIAQAREGSIQKPTVINPRVPRGLEAICGRAMSKETADRYSTALELAKDVQRWLNDEPVSAWNEPLPIRVRRWLRKHQAIAASIAATTVIAVGAIAGIVAFKNQQLDRSNDELKTAQTGLKSANQTLGLTNHNLQQRNDELQREQARGQLALEIGFRLLRGIESHKTWSIDDAYSDILQNGLKLPDHERAAMLPLFQAMIDMQQADQLNRIAERIVETDAISRMKLIATKAGAAGKLGTALNNLEEAIQHHQQSGLAWLLKAQIRRELLQQPAANVLPDWNRVTELLPTSSAAVSGRGWCYLLLKNHDEAERDLHKAIEIDPGNEYARAGLGELAELRKDLDSAVLHRSSAADLPPRFNTDKVWQLGAKVLASRAYWARAVDRDAKKEFAGAFDDTILAVQFGQPRECKLLWENSLDLAHRLSVESASAALPKLRAATSRFRERPEFDFGRDVLVAVLETQTGVGDPQAWKDLQRRRLARPEVATELSDNFQSNLRLWQQTTKASESIRSAVADFLNVLKLD